jgi:hypothetical protein
MSTAPGAGAKLACSPLPNAVICNDKRFSCPAGSTCSHKLCTPDNGGDPFTAFISQNANYVASSTYGDGVDNLPTDAPGLKGNLGSDICKSLIPKLPSFCMCEAYWDGSSVMCQVNVGDFFNTFINAEFKPCGSGSGSATTRFTNHSWGAGFLAKHVASGEMQFIDDYHQRSLISGANFSMLNNGVYAVADVSGKIKNAQIKADVSLDVCGQVNVNVEKFSGCASESNRLRKQFSEYLDVPGARPPFFVAWQYMPPRCAF